MVRSKRQREKRRAQRKKVQQDMSTAAVVIESGHNEPSDFALEKRERALAELLSIYPYQVTHGGIAKGLAKDRDASWHFGRLYLIGLITKRQLNAADYIAKITRRYESMLNRYGLLRAANPEKVGGKTIEDLSDRAAKRFLSIQRNYDRVYGLLDECGEKTREAVVKGLRNDPKSDLDYIRRGLEVIARVVRS